jgi:hypothetical protein
MAINNFFNQTITVENPAETRNRQGRFDFDTPITLKARVERTNRTVTSAEHDRVPIDAVIYSGPAFEVKNGAKITYGSDTFLVVTKSDVVKGNGRLHHYEIMARLWSFA